MSGINALTEQFEEHRGYLRGVAYRMLGSLSEADDAVQEAWIRSSQAELRGIDNLRRWLTTVVARICLDTLRAQRRREMPLRGELSDEVPTAAHEAAASEESELAEAVGLALMVVLHKLKPKERLAFVLHDMFELPFEDIAPMVNRSPTAARQLVCRARRRVRGSKTIDGDLDLAEQRRVVEAFLAASRQGDLQALLRVLDPEVVLRADDFEHEVRGAATVARQALAFRDRSPFGRMALVNGAVGIIVAPRGHLRVVLGVRSAAGRIVAIEVVTDPARLASLDIEMVPAAAAC